jgi:hypothetical protein
MQLKLDIDALESLPLKLMIVAVVACMSVIPAGQALEGLRDRDYVARAKLQLETVISTAQTLMIDGPGGVRTVHLDFDHDGSQAFDRLMIGDERGGPNMSSIVLRLKGGASIVRSATEPEVWMTGTPHGRVVVESPTCDLRLSAQIVDRTAFVLVELV